MRILQIVLSCDANRKQISSKSRFRVSRALLAVVLKRDVTSRVSPFFALYFKLDSFHSISLRIDAALALVGDCGIDDGPRVPNECIGDFFSSIPHAAVDSPPSVKSPKSRSELL